jgi:ABC-type lipoprotein export system ATPase subunit
MIKLTGENITKEYPGGVKALNNVNIQIEKGDIAVIIGPSGSGKTTLLNILGLLDKPTKGRVVMDGKDITLLDEKQAAQLMNQQFGFIFQFFYLIPELTVVENVLLPLWIKEKTTLKIKFYNEAENLLSEFGLSNRKNFYPYQLSGGELQRVAICRSLICNPSVVFADEPTGSIDKKSTEIFFELVEKLNNQKNVTFVICTHNEKFLDFATKMISLNQGEIVKYEKNTT